MIPVYDENNKVIAKVQSSRNLDWWDGSNFISGGSGRHKGLTQLKNKQYVLIYTSDIQGVIDQAVVITKEEALQEVYSSNNEDLLDRFTELKEYSDKTLLTEM